MSGLDPKRLALIHSVVRTATGSEHLYGTGYFLTSELVLTAHHVLSKGTPERVEIRLADIPPGHDSHWMEVDSRPVWNDARLDAALIRVTLPVFGDLPFPDWAPVSFTENQTWDSVGYPQASSERTSEGTEFRTAGLSGTLYVHGGGGPGTRDLDLGVRDEALQWGGISGAPVFVSGKLVGIIKSSLPSYAQKRLRGVPFDLLQSDPGFRTAVAPRWLDIPPPDRTWVLVLTSEKEHSALAQRVQAAVKKQAEGIARAAGTPVEPTPCVVAVLDALQSPERLLRFVQAICVAPIMVVDVTGFEPAVMLFLGIRAVVRRGVTLTVTSAPEKDSLSNLPFNIQETKLIRLSGNHAVQSPLYPVNRIGTAMVDGLTQLRGHPNYLDLPAYNAVRTPKPEDFAGAAPKSEDLADASSAQEKILILCSFQDAYEKNWNYLSDALAVLGSPKTLERMVDISSPRLVGLALYESIRWTPCCMVDWTHWRANVFFELGVRLACSDVGPVSLIEATHASEHPQLGKEAPSADTHPSTPPAAGASPLEQNALLIELLDPIPYRVGESWEQFEEAFRRYEANINGQYRSPDEATIPHDAIHQVIVSSYVWTQEPISRLPHDELRASVQSYLGKDPQKQGRLQVLFSSNPEFARELTRSVQERWIAAWYYLRGRHSMEEFLSSAELRDQLLTLGEEVVQALARTPEYERIYEEIIRVNDELEESAFSAERERDGESVTDDS